MRFTSYLQSITRLLHNLQHCYNFLRCTYHVLPECDSDYYCLRVKFFLDKGREKSKEPDGLYPDIIKFRSGKKENIMKRRTGKLLAMLGMTAFMAASLTGCGNSTEDAAQTETTETTEVTENTAAEEEAAVEETEEETTEETEEETGADLSGSIAMAGSTSMEKLANAVAEAFMNKYPEVTVTAEFTGSGAGIESLLGGSIDIGNTSRNLKDEEKEGGAVENIVAIDGIAVIVDNANTVENLTKDQLVSIYKGEITNWSEVGGEDAPIVVVGRESGSGTRDGFESILEVEEACKYASELDSTGAVIAKVASTPGAIGYASLGDVDDSVKKVSLEGAEANVENIQNGSYILSRPFVMATMGEISEQSDAVQALFDYLQSDEGKEVIESVGLINVK